MTTERDGETEARSLLWEFSPGTSADRLHTGLYDRKSQPRTTLVRRFVRAKKSLEQVIPLFDRNSQTVVRNVDDQLWLVIALLDARVDRDDAAGRRIVGVRDRIAYVVG